MKKSTAYERWVTGFIERLSEYFDLAGWQITVNYADDEENNGRGNVYAKIAADSVYLMADIVVFPVGKADYEAGDLKRLTYALTHEMTHILVDPLADFTQPYLSDITGPLHCNIVEQVTQRLTMVFLKTLPQEITNGLNHTAPKDNSRRPTVSKAGAARLRNKHK